MPDVTVRLTKGSNVIEIHPQSEDAKSWVSEWILGDKIGEGEYIPCEHRFLHDIVEGVRNDGITVEALWV